MTIFRYFREDYDNQSKTNAYLCSLLSYYVYDDLSAGVVEMNFEDRFANTMSTLRPEDDPFTVTHYSGNSVDQFPFDTECIVVNNQRVAIVVFRGTEGIPILSDNGNTVSSLRDWLTNLQFPITNPSDLDRAGVHLGFWGALNTVYNSLRTGLRELVESNPNIRIFFTGHSLGGALATLCAFRMQKKVDEISVSGVYTFGAPRVGNHVFLTLYQNTFISSGVTLWDRTWRWVNNADLVPQFFKHEPFFPRIGNLTPNPLETYYHVGEQNFIRANGSVELNRPWSDSNDDAGLRASSGADHSMSYMCRRMYRRLRTDDRESPNSPDWLVKDDVIAVRSIW